MPFKCIPFPAWWKKTGAKRAASLKHKQKYYQGISRCSLNFHKVGKRGRNKLKIESCYFAIVLKNVPALALEPTLESLDNRVSSDTELQHQLNSRVLPA